VRPRTVVSDRILEPPRDRRRAFPRRWLRSRGYGHRIRAGSFHLLLIPSLHHEPTRYALRDIRHPHADTIPGREAFQRLAQQFAKAQRQATSSNFGRGAGGGGGGPGNAKGFLAGSGLLVALAVGGIAVNQALFNGKFGPRDFPVFTDNRLQSTVVIEQSSTRG
jgi:hypothetical protein